MNRPSKENPGCGWLACAAVALALGGCAQAPVAPQPTFTYTPPAPLQKFENTRVIDASFDQTWRGLIDYVSRSFFEIRNFEKASGLMTLAFGSNAHTQFVDCGMWNSTERYIERDLGFVLSGQMNLVVESVTPGRTRVTINTRYHLRDKYGTVYEFTSNTTAAVHVRNPTPGTIPIRTCRSTHAAEKQVITGISAIATR